MSQPQPEYSYEHNQTLVKYWNYDYGRWYWQSYNQGKLGTEYDTQGMLTCLPDQGGWAFHSWVNDEAERVNAAAYLSTDHSTIRQSHFGSSGQSTYQPAGGYTTGDATAQAGASSSYAATQPVASYTTQPTGSYPAQPNYPAQPTPTLTYGTVPAAGQSAYNPQHNPNQGGHGRQDSVTAFRGRGNKIYGTYDENQHNSPKSELLDSCRSQENSRHVSYTNF